MTGHPNIEHFIVLMLENRSFDHMLGHLYPAADGFEGVKGKEDRYYNHSDPSSPASPKHHVSDKANTEDLAIDPSHNFASVQEQLFGAENAGGGAATPTKNGGFVFNYGKKAPDAGPRVMNCFNPQTLPVLSRLAYQYAVCDHWFSSTPGPTWPNRLFAHIGSSDGRADNFFWLYHNKTVFDLLAEAGKTFAFFAQGGVTQGMALTSLHSRRRQIFQGLDAFRTGAAKGKLPHYCVVEPRFFRSVSRPATDQHPPHDVHRGEELIADVYKAIRSSPLWKRSMLLITYDEHGGIYDHLPPPPAVPPGPISTDPPFEFDRYGVRVPGVVVGPYVGKGEVWRSIFDHTSILATLRSLFGFAGSLSERDAKAASLAQHLQEKPRSDEDCPRDIRDLIPAGDKALMLESMVRADVRAKTGAPKLNDYQRQLLDMSRQLAERGPRPLEQVAAELGYPSEWQEDAAAREIEDNVETFLARQQ